MKKLLYTFNPYVVCGAIMMLLGAYTVTEEYHIVPRIILVVGMIVAIFGFWNDDEIEHALRTMRKSERGAENGALRNNDSKRAV